MLLLSIDPLAANAQFGPLAVPHTLQSGIHLVQTRDIKARADKIIAQHLRLYSPVIDPASTFEKLGADDLNMVEITLDLESEFDIIIPDEEIEKVQTESDLIVLIEKIVAAKSK